MKVTYSWLIYSYLIFGIDVFCERILEKRQTVSSCKIADHYTCISGQCINKSSICDGTQDCNDGSDETLSLCETLRCENNKFRCKYGACVNMDSKCDGVQQCADGSDEKNCFGPISISADTSSLKLVNNTSELKTESNKKGMFAFYRALKEFIYSYQGSDDILAHGTLINHNRTIIENCEIGYHKAYPNSFRVCQNNGTWTSKSEKLCFKCGRSYIGHQLLIDNGKKAQIGTAPWNVAVYRFNKENSKYDLICGGSLIAPNLIVSAAHCFWQNGMLSNRISINNGLYRIAVGKYYRNYTVIDNDFTQILDVETIYLQEDYYGYHRHYSHDIAVIVLSNRVNISLAVAAACVDWDGRYIVTNETQGKIVGWGITENDTPSPVLLEATLPYIDYNSCRSMYKNGFEQFVTFDKFCAGSASGQGVREGDSGAGLTFLHSDFYYLTGIVSLKDPNTKNSIAVFTNVRFYIKWLRELYNKYSSYESDNMLDTKNACVLPTTDGVIYSYEDSDKILAHGTLIKQHRVVIENCEVGYQKAYPSGLRICQGNGEWILNSKNLCFKKCPPLLSDSLDIKCTLNGNHVNCSSPSIPNTIANALCKLTRRLPNGQGGPPIELRCQSNGTWNNQLYECTTYCGRPYTRDQLLIDNGNTTAQVGTAPWNVGIYRFDKANSEYDLICGGSLIAPNLVVSAAHCFWNISMPRLFIVEMMKGSIKVAVGKFTRNYTVIDNEFTQMMDVKEIHLNRGYNGNDEARANDISVIVLKDKVTISAGVAPVCMDWNCAKVWQVPYGTRGKIVGWGKTENDTLSPVLLETTLSSIDQESCRMMYYGDKFQMFVTGDKFCAESKGGQGVHQTDSGAGLTFSHSDFYYLAGVLSVKDTNPDNPIVIFTDVLYHIEWLHDMYNKYIS